MKRNTQQTYRAEQRRLVCRHKALKSEQLIPMIQKYLARIWSPEQISHTALKEVISFKIL